jgi:hypothetical protein
LVFLLHACLCGGWRLCTAYLLLRDAMWGCHISYSTGAVQGMCVRPFRACERVQAQLQRQELPGCTVRQVLSKTLVWFFWRVLSVLLPAQNA